MLEELWLIHPGEAMCAAFAAKFAGLPRVRIVQARFEDLEPHDCFVTARHSSRTMSALLEAAVVRRFGPELMQAVQFRILDEFYGEQPIGSAFVVPTGDLRLPFLCHSPTMRTPGCINGTDKVYTATWAALLAVQMHNRQQRDARIDVVAFPAMGTGFGGMPNDEAARQMAAAYRHFLDPPHRFDWDVVTSRERTICYDGGKQVAR